MPDFSDILEKEILTPAAEHEAESILPGEIGGKVSIDSMVSHLLKSYDLDEKDVRIISMLFNSLLDGKDRNDGIKAMDILKPFANDKTIAFRELKRITRLKNLGILQVSSGNDSDNDNAAGILRSTYQLSADVINALCDDSEGLRLSPPAPLHPYSSNLEYLADQFERIKVLESAGSPERGLRRFIERASKSARITNPESRLLEEKIQGRLALTEILIPFEEFKRQKKLIRKEELIVIALLKKEMFAGGYWEVDALLDLVSDSSYDRLAGMQLFERNSRLIREGMAEFTESDIFRRGRAVREVRLGAELRHLFLGESKRHRRGKTSDDFFEISKPDISFEEVVLPQETLSGITLAISMIQGQAVTRLNEWGFKHNLQASARRKSQPVIILFYGPPGTGKTLAANAIAYELNRPVLSLDCSRIVDKYVGESQKNTRMIFDNYREAAKKMKKAPILLLNEADQFLQKRMDVLRSVDSMYKQMQNIFLEQMEKFEGVLIATTNLADHLDPAFSRRFHHKIGFRKPGPEERLRLWRVHMPDEAPLAGDVDIGYLAEHYTFTGGQIAVAIRNAAAKAAIRGDIIRQDDLIEACDSEHAGNFDEKPRQRIGF